jgi:hypothetical protein
MSFNILFLKWLAASGTNDNLHSTKSRCCCYIVFEALTPFTGVFLLIWVFNEVDLTSYYGAFSFATSGGRAQNFWESIASLRKFDRSINRARCQNTLGFFSRFANVLLSFSSATSLGSADGAYLLRRKKTCVSKLKMLLHGEH